ncbi:bifunctional ADP-dependent NAD(P)H-hydrate dehydratase/NAD(P)H-hydrate epimerase [Photobacterium kishitanii]|uniref:NAD(P)H-hydrate dehydratase n=1 Tax=Photobacterium kishitanii TaxID=318456 RepID=UPI000D15FFC8|nr:NAD(P)H-hydrate dehydratase [Photobacterium kishitanii]PSV11912.1 bifunctional ADP-dependent NAD(P)H-hydrate dehydratase/NAD(P)H-hydrate epimerase [Photobacterium kishitanii]
MSTTTTIPNCLYRAQDVRQGEQQLAAIYDIDLYQLMERAGKAVFELMLKSYPDAKQILVCCGSGNNGGDGYVVARLAQQYGLSVIVWEKECGHQTSDAARARQLWLATTGTTTLLAPQKIDEIDVIVDGLIGTGLSVTVNDEISQRILWINATQCPVIAIDVPSGLCADTGAILGVAINAAMTVSFIGFKQGLATGQAAQYCGQRYFTDLEVGELFSPLVTASAWHIDATEITTLLPPRSRVAHKGDNGRVVCLGGDHGTFGAIRLCAEACCRTGAGLTAVITQADSALSIVTARPEIMALGWHDDTECLQQKLAWATVAVIGPGLGQSEWSQRLYLAASQNNLPCVVDADGLNLLATMPMVNSLRILTPHPGEAARLLNISIAEIEADRFAAVKLLQQSYGGVVILKGAGTIIYDGEHIFVCTAGNPGMATGGMGDVLSGIIAALIAQGLSLSQAARTGVWIHSKAADLCAQSGERGMLAADLFPFIRQLVNPR